MQHHNLSNIRSFGGQTPSFGEKVFIDPSAVVLGDVVLGDDVSVWPQVAVDSSTKEDSSVAESS